MYTFILLSSELIQLLFYQFVSLILLNNHFEITLMLISLFRLFKVNFHKWSLLFIFNWWLNSLEVFLILLICILLYHYQGYYIKHSLEFVIIMLLCRVRKRIDYLINCIQIICNLYLLFFYFKDLCILKIYSVWLYW